MCAGVGSVNADQVDEGPPISSTTSCADAAGRWKLTASGTDRTDSPAPISLKTRLHSGARLKRLCEPITMNARGRGTSPAAMKHGRVGRTVQILLTNDDGIYAPGLAAMERQLERLGDVAVVAPATEQSGVGHSITFLSPLVCKEVYDGDRRRGWAVEGSPADSVKLGVVELCPQRPELVVSGINGGLNAGINVLYSGTVAAAIEGAFFGITSVAVSLEFDEHADYDKAARLACQVIDQILQRRSETSQLFNLNIPTAAIHNPRGIRVVPMGVARYGEHFLRRTDPRGRTYYWATSEPAPAPGEHETDLTALHKGFVTLTPLHYDMTQHVLLSDMEHWDLAISPDL